MTLARDTRVGAASGRAETSALAAITACIWGVVGLAERLFDVAPHRCRDRFSCRRGLLGLPLVEKHHQAAKAALGGAGQVARIAITAASSVSSPSLWANAASMIWSTI